MLRPITTSSNANAAKAAEILTYLFIIFPFHGCLVSGPAEDGEGGLWAPPGLRTPVAPTGLGHQGPALERVPHRLTQSRRFVRLSVNAGWPPPFGSNTTNGVSPAAPALAKILSIARYLPRDPFGLVSPIGLVKNHPRTTAHRRALPYNTAEAREGPSPPITERPRQMFHHNPPSKGTPQEGNATSPPATQRKHEDHQPSYHNPHQKTHFHPDYHPPLDLPAIATIPSFPRPPRRSRESGNPGQGPGAGPSPLTSFLPPSPSPRPLSSFPRKREPRAGARRGGVPRGPARGRPPLVAPSLSPSPLPHHRRSRAPLVVPAKAGTQGRGPARGRPPLVAPSPSRHPHSPHRRSRAPFRRSRESGNPGQGRGGVASPGTRRGASPNYQQTPYSQR